MKNQVRICTCKVDNKYTYLQVYFPVWLSNAANIDRGDMFEWDLDENTLKMRVSSEGRKASKSGDMVYVNLNQNALNETVDAEFPATWAPFVIVDDWIVIDLPESVFKREKGFHLIDRIKSFARAA